jgi:hypothetical protein
MSAVRMTRTTSMLRHLLLAVTLFSVAAPVGSAWAQGGQCVKGPVRKAKGSMTEGTFRRLEKVNKLIVDNKNDEALADLREMSEKSSYSGYEKALILQTMAFVYGGMNKYGKAIEIFEQVLAMDVLPQPAWESMLYNTGQLHLADGKIDKAIKTLEEYMCQAQGTISADARVALGSAYAEKKRWRDALKQVELALEGVKAPKESWLQFKLALHFELKEYPQCAETLLMLIGIAPAKEDYWKQLSSIFFELKNDQQSMTTLAVADIQGFIDEEREIRNLANIYLLMEIPYKAGMLLQRGFDKGVLKPEEKLLTMLADSWYLAREYRRAEAALKKLAEHTGKGDVYVRLAQLAIEDEKWKEALAYMDQARAKGSTKKGQMGLMSGIAYFNLDKVAEARKELSLAGAEEETRGQAVAWMNYIDQVEASKAQAIAAQKAIEEARKEREERAAKFEKMMSGG